MSALKTSSDLRLAIEGLEIQQKVQIAELKLQFQTTYESLSAVNIIKGALREATTSKDIREQVADTAVGIIAGYLTRMIFIGKSHNPLKKFIGSVILVGVSNILTKYPGIVGNIGKIVTKVVAGGTAKTADKQNSSET